MLNEAFLKWKLISQKCGSLVIQLECHRDINPSVTFTSGDHCGVPFSMHTGKGKCCMWLFNKVEIYFPKKGFIDSKMSNLIAPGSNTHWCRPLYDALFCACRKGKCCMWHVNKVEIYFPKVGFMDSKWSNLNTLGSYTHWYHSLLGSSVGCLP